ncbi:hypothetical protein ACFU2J_33850 [Streptomyces sp. NPDC057387]|uniref:hypothetical protein n=1 Tax=Streptomyces sp. NPDC057387 TaxID=3346115 RepID=UPI00362629AD
MTRVVFVHGIAQETKGEESLLGEWYPALCDGLALAGAVPIGRTEVSMAFWGHVFRPAGHRALGLPPLDAFDVEQGLEEELLLGWWEAAAAAERRVPGPEEPARLRTPRLVQRALNALSHSAFFAGLGESLMVHAARQVRRYFTESDVRSAVQDEFAKRVTDRTEVVVAHSLGSVVAYEALCAHPGWRDLTLVTLGSPLGVRKLVFDRLVPPPAGGAARWPVPVKAWTNVADAGDAVALVKELAPAFGRRINDVPVHNGARAHDARPYLTARETGAAVARALNQSDTSR